MTALVAAIIFLFGYILVAHESRIRVSRSFLALGVSGILWIIVGMQAASFSLSALEKVGYQIFTFVVFFFGSISLVDLLVQHRFFDVVRAKIFAHHYGDRQQFISITSLTFFLSAILSTLPAVIFMIHIARQFLRGKNMLLAAVGIVIAANAGGAFSPLGDVTTLMMWFSGKFSALEIMSLGFIPAFFLYAVSTFVLSRKIEELGADMPPEVTTGLTFGEKVISGMVFLSFAVTILGSMYGIPPFIGILLGLGVTTLIIELLNIAAPQPTHLSSVLDHTIQKSDFAALKFFIAILLSIAALGFLGVHDVVAPWIEGDGTLIDLLKGIMVVSVSSIFFSTVPVTAFLLEAVPYAPPLIWIFVSLSMSFIGSLVVYGSSAGIIVKGLVKELTFKEYARLAVVPTLLGGAAMAVIIFVEYLFLF